jgi:hypothetical protein
VIRIC